MRRVPCGSKIPRVRLGAYLRPSSLCRASRRVLDLTRREILQGLCTDEDASRVLRHMRRFQILDTGSVELAAVAARNDRLLWVRDELSTWKRCILELPQSGRRDASPSVGDLTDASARRSMRTDVNRPFATRQEYPCETMTPAQLAPAASPLNPVLVTPAPFARSNERASVQLALATDLDSADGARRMTTRDTLFGCVGHPGGDRNPRIGAIQSYDVGHRD